jgi:lipoprotein-anchoring transpeptidase ErfK/SrfK
MAGRSARALIDSMRRTKYKLPASRNRPSNFLYWAAAIALVVALAWLWWQSVKNPQAKPNPKPPTALKPVETNLTRRVVAPLPVSKPADTSPSTRAWPRPVQNIFEAQLALVQQGISPGSLDGAIGSQTRSALTAFQQKENLPLTGELDAATKVRLTLDAEPCTAYTVTSNDLARLQPVAPTWLGKSQQTALDYESILELVAEKSFSHPNFIRRLNPSINWTNVAIGTVVQMPAAVYPDINSRAAFVRIHLSGKILEAFDDATNLLVHFPCSIARRVEKRPVGELHVVVVAPNPNYTLDPQVFPESPEAQQLNRKLILPPGPNNPVGVAWIGLDLAGYGIHGTPHPEEVGRTESHGCFRLANWNAEYLLRLIAVGTPVYVLE